MVDPVDELTEDVVRSGGSAEFVSPGCLPESASLGCCALIGPSSRASDPREFDQDRNHDKARPIGVLTRSTSNRAT